MPQRYSEQELYQVRNAISVQRVIQELLRLPCREAERHFCFACPCCTGFDTKVNPRTNLARCFSCGRNFNPIDLVMLVRGLSFVRSVELLRTFQGGSSAGRVDTTTSKEPTRTTPQSIRQILQGVLLGTQGGAV